MHRRRGGRAAEPLLSERAAQRRLLRRALPLLLLRPPLAVEGPRAREGDRGGEGGQGGRARRGRARGGGAVAVAASTPAATTSAVVKAISAVPSAPAGASPTTWKVADVSVWLESIELPMHVEAFKEHSVNGKMLLALTDQDLYQTLGIQSPLHRKKLLMEISAARKAYLNP